MLNLRKSRGQYVHDSALLRAGQGEPCLLLFFLSTPGRFLKMPCRASSWEFFFIRRAPAASESVLRNAGHRIFPAAEYAHGRRCAFSAWEHFNKADGKEICFGLWFYEASSTPCEAGDLLSAGQRFWGLYDSQRLQKTRLGGISRCRLFGTLCRQESA